MTEPRLLEKVRSIFEELGRCGTDDEQEDCLVEVLEEAHAAGRREGIEEAAKALGELYGGPALVRRILARLPPEAK